MIIAERETMAPEEAPQSNLIYRPRYISDETVKNALDHYDSATFETDKGKLVYGDYLALLDSIPVGGVDMVFTDCPYWTLNKHRSVGTTTRLGGGLKGDSDSDKFFNTISQNELYELICEFDRVLPKNADCWLMCDGQTLPYIGMIAHEGETNFKYFKPYPVIKRAKTGNFRSGMGYHGKGAHEYVCLLQKGKNNLRDKNWDDVFDFVWDGDAWSKQFTPDGEKYPTAKPVSFIDQIIRLSSDAGQTVLDPFAGSGSCAAAALNCGRRYLTGDASKRSIRTAQAAINAGSRHYLFDKEGARCS